MQLSDEEREHIRLSEEYRAEVRSKLDAPAPKGESWLDKLAVPMLIVLVSGLLIPWILERVADNHRAFELQSRLIEQIVADDAAAQVNLIQFHSQVRNHWFEFLKIQFEKRLVALRETDAAERQARREELQQDLARERTQYDAAFAEAMAGSTKAVVEQRATASGCACTTARPRSCSNTSRRRRRSTTRDGKASPRFRSNWPSCRRNRAKRSATARTRQRVSRFFGRPRRGSSNWEGGRRSSGSGMTRDAR